MNLGEILRTVFVEIRGHKMRSVLTLLGIILGTFAITVMTSFLDGIVASVWRGFSDLGFDGVMYVVDREPKDLREQSIFARSKGLQPEDAAVLLSHGKLVWDVAPAVYDEAMIKRGTVERNARIMGVTPSFARVRGRRVAEGRFIDESDERMFARVCVLGHRLKQRLFGAEDPLGKTVLVGGTACRVVGVGPKLGNQFFDEDDFAEEMEGLYVPLSTIRKLYSGQDAPLSFMAVKTRQFEKLGELEAEVLASLRIAHRGAQDFRVQNIAQEIVKARVQVGEIITNWRIVMGSISGISLLVGGIGLLSVMLISIGERLYEIGLRKAIGATDLEIFLQFLFESVILSVIGGLLGAGFGILTTKLVGGFVSTGFPIHMMGVVSSIGIAIVLGVLYGIYPALKASRLAPVEALRSAA